MFSFLTHPGEDNDGYRSDVGIAEKRKVTPSVGNCERCGSDRFVRTAKVNGQRVCLACEDLLKPDPMTAYKQMVERGEE